VRVNGEEAKGSGFECTVSTNKPHNCEIITSHIRDTTLTGDFVRFANHALCATKKQTNKQTNKNPLSTSFLTLFFTNICSVLFCLICLFYLFICLFVCLFVWDPD
jgi:hypothetical protein